MRRLFFSLLLFGLTCPIGVFADLYQWTDRTGVIHIVDESVEVPAEFRDSLKVYRTIKANQPSAPGKTLLPARLFAKNTQGSFAQKLARDLGLIEEENDNALTALTGAGISPAGGWKVYDPLSREAAYEVIASARRAAESRRFPLSADGAEGVVRQALGSFTFSDALPEDELPAKRTGYNEQYNNNEPIVVEYVQEIIEVVPQPVYSYSPWVAGTSHHRPYQRFSRPRRFRHQPLEPSDAFVASPFSSSRFINKRSGRRVFSTPAFPLRQPPPFPLASPHPGMSTSPLPLRQPSPFPLASPHPGVRR
jgi:hypothetical protein